MLNWITHQFAELNVVAIVIIFAFVTFMSRNDMTKQLKAQSQEFYKEFEEIKAEIWRAQGGGQE